MQLVGSNSLEQLSNVTENELLTILESTEPTQDDDLLNIRNGKRIWRILSEAHVGDIAEAWIADWIAGEPEREKKQDEQDERYKVRAIAGKWWPCHNGPTPDYSTPSAKSVVLGSLGHMIMNLCPLQY